VDNSNTKPPSPRRSVLDLAPLELDCMNTLWPMGEGTVREIRDRLAERRPRAYTTIMTIMDRLARKGIVERRKSGRAYIYVPNLTAQEARSHALSQVVESFFGGSKAAMLDELGATATIPQARAAAAAAGAFGNSSNSPRPSDSFARKATQVVAATVVPTVDTIETAEKYFEEVERIDDTLL
jgi:BlaI family transcriptional regulator, penicillinase repressor